jgi:hypothetical protein
VFLGGIQITVILILPSKTRMCRKIFLWLASSYDRRNIYIFIARTVEFKNEIGLKSVYGNTI